MELDFIFECDQAGIFTLPRNDVDAVLTNAYIPSAEQGINGRIERVFTGSSPDRLLLLAKQASLDIIPNWIVLELKI